MFLRARDEEVTGAENDGVKGKLSPPTCEDGDELFAADISYYSHGEDMTRGSQVADGWTSSSGYGSGKGTALTSVSGNHISKSQALDCPTFGVEGQCLSYHARQNPIHPYTDSNLDVHIASTPW